MSSEDFASYGVETFYMNVPVAEPAGGGNVRIWNCALKNGVLVPQCEIIIPAVELLVASRIISSAALDVFRMERGTMLVH